MENYKENKCQFLTVAIKKVNCKCVLLYHNKPVIFLNVYRSTYSLLFIFKKINSPYFQLNIRMSGK